MKMTLTVVFVILFNFCFGQRPQDSANKKNDEYSLDIDSLKKVQIQLYIDSLNNYTANAIVPQFIYNKCLDNGRFWNDFHSPESTRWKILEQVNNKAVLEKLLKTNDKRLKEKCQYKDDSTMHLKVALANKSTRNLIETRLHQLK